MLTFQIMVIGGPDLGRRFPLTASETVIGRGAECSLQLADPSASRVQCRILLSGGRAILVDAKSRWGTLVNDAPIEQHTLAPGDVITVGETLLRFELPPTADVTLPPARLGAAPAVPPLEPIPATSPPRPSANPRGLVGRKLLRFEVQAILAEGRTGILFRAVEDPPLRLVALKVLWTGQAEEQRARFIRTIRAAIDLQHPNLVTLYSAGKTGPYCWLASELIEGENLTQVIQRVGVSGMLDWTYAFRVALGVARALDAAFKRRILHRNIMPHNILVRSTDGRIKLGDLLLAKAFDDDAGELTQPGEIVGNLAYLSPEQTGTLDRVDQRSDIYSLGATVYALLTGRPPCMGATLAETILKIQRERPEPPTCYHLAVPPLFEGVVMRMLAKRPEERFATPAHLLRDLARVATYVGRPDLLEPEQAL